jgi:hypothetical protein
MAELRHDLARDGHPAPPARRTRQRMLVWSLALVALLHASRPTTARASGPEARLLRGTATVGGHRLGAVGEAARTTPGDVLTVAPGGRLELYTEPARVALLGGGRLLVEALGPPALRLLSGEADVLGPLVLQTLAGTLRVPPGVAVEIRLGGASAGPSPAAPVGPGPLVFVADGPGAEVVDARGVQSVAVMP